MTKGEVLSRIANLWADRIVMADLPELTGLSEAEIGELSEFAKIRAGAVAEEIARRLRSMGTPAA